LAASTSKRQLEYHGDFAYSLAQLNPLLSYIFIELVTTNALFAQIGTTLVKRRFSPGLKTIFVLDF
jgi:hypothetical protein